MATPDWFWRILIPLGVGATVFIGIRLYQGWEIDQECRFLGYDRGGYELTTAVCFRTTTVTTPLYGRERE